MEDNPDPLLYLEKCKDFLSINPLTPEELIVTLRNVLYGTARDWWDVTRATTHTWSGFESGFLSAFLSKDYELSVSQLSDPSTSLQPGPPQANCWRGKGTHPPYACPNFNQNRKSKQRYNYQPNPSQRSAQNHPNASQPTNDPDTVITLAHTASSVQLLPLLPFYKV